MMNEVAMPKSKTLTLLITGATGNIGRELTKKLSAQRVPFRAMVKLCRALGREIEYVDVPPEAMIEALLRIGFPRWQADGLIEDYAHYRRGEASAIATGVQDATGRAPHSFDDFARDYASAFS
jgi:uncharacterized protein YbjT (DUF2867 family)